jgi:uncharacterized protein YijF (DUF1287 family)
LPSGGAGDSTDTVPRLPVPAESELASNDDSTKDTGPRVCLGPAAVTLPAENASDAESFGARLAAAALTQTRDLVIYTAKYHPIRYPMGDLAPLYGACTDVIIRAYRALGIDLQQLVHDARIGSGDTNVDHRRTEVLRRFFTRRGASLPVTHYPEDYLPGDIVTYERPFSRVSRSHIAMVADALGPAGRPLIVHNRGWGPQLEDALFADRITGHYRFVPFSTPQEVRGEPSLASAMSTSAGNRGGRFKVRTKAAGLVLPAPAGFAAKP